MEHSSKSFITFKSAKFNLSFWRALELGIQRQVVGGSGRINKCNAAAAKALFTTFYGLKPYNEYSGVKADELPAIEKKFDVAINVYRKEDSNLIAVNESKRTDKAPINLLDDGNYALIIKIHTMRDNEQSYNALRYEYNYWLEQCNKRDDKLKGCLTKETLIEQLRQLMPHDEFAGLFVDRKDAKEVAAVRQAWELYDALKHNWTSHAPIYYTKPTATSSQVWRFLRKHKVDMMPDGKVHWMAGDNPVIDIAKPETCVQPKFVPAMYAGFTSDEKQWMKRRSIKESQKLLGELLSMDQDKLRQAVQGTK